MCFIESGRDKRLTVSFGRMENSAFPLSRIMGYTQMVLPVFADSLAASVTRSVSTALS